MEDVGVLSRKFCLCKRQTRFHVPGISAIGMTLARSPLSKACNVKEPQPRVF